MARGWVALDVNDTMIETETPVEGSDDHSGRRIRVRADERPPVVICHLAALVPLWALAANAVLYFVYRESSRMVCFHARQCLHFHMLLMATAVPLFLVEAGEKMLRLLRVPEDWLGNLPLVGQTLLFGVYGAYCCVCLLGALQALRGRVFVYPLVGRALYNNYILAPRSTT
ncbi:MAG: DUF4870 domain-containing protein [Candidatus Sumerlaeota bacterium]